MKTDKSAVAGPPSGPRAFPFRSNALGLPGATNPTADLARSAGILVVGSHLLESHPIVGIQVRQAVQKGARAAAHRRQTQALQPDGPDGFNRSPQNGGRAWSRGFSPNSWQPTGSIRPYLEGEPAAWRALHGGLAKVSLESVAAETGISLPALKEAAAFLAEHRPLAVICPPPFLPGESFHPSLIQGLIRLQLLSGSLGKTGGGLYLLPRPANAWGPGPSGPPGPRSPKRSFWTR